MNKLPLENPKLNLHKGIGAHVGASCIGGVDGRPARVNLHLRASADDRSLVWRGSGFRVTENDTDSLQEKQSIDTH